MILMVGGEKGGVGKTTLAAHLAALQKQAGHNVVLVDTDPQGSASQWAEARRELDDEVAQFLCVSVRGSKVNCELQDMAQVYEHVVVDTGGADSSEFRASLVAADMLLMPLRPGSFDFWTLAKMNEILALVEPVNPRLKTVLVLTQVPATAYERARREAEEIISELPRFTLLKTLIVFRAAFGHAVTDGRIVNELDRRDPKACSEISLLHGELFGRAGEAS
jgi:chromosome partitioning protein